MDYESPYIPSLNTVGIMLDVMYKSLFSDAQVAKQFVESGGYGRFAPVPASVFSPVPKGIYWNYNMFSNTLELYYNNPDGRVNNFYRVISIFQEGKWIIAMGSEEVMEASDFRRLKIIVAYLNRYAASMINGIVPTPPQIKLLKPAEVKRREKMFRGGTWTK